MSIGTLAAGTDKVLINDLGITVSDNVPDLGIATIKLLLKDQVTEKHYTIDICIHAPQLQIINCILEDKTTGNGDNIPDPGETFKLIFKVRNQGSSDISGQFGISSSDQDLSIVDPNVKSGVLKFGETSDIPVLVKLSPATPSGSFVSVAAILDCNPYIVNHDFSFRVGKIRESFEASSFSVFPWINISTVPWVISSSASVASSLSERATR